MPGIARKLVNKLKIGNTLVKTTSGDVTMADQGIVIINKDAAATTTVTLTPSPDTGDVIFIKDGKGDAATYNITVQAASGNIDGSSTFVISENYGAAVFAYNGTQWNVVARGQELAAAELAFLNGVTAGTAAASKALVLDASSNLTGVGRLGVDGLRFEDIGTLAATGTVIANAAAIANRVTVVTGADDAKGVVLPTAVAGDAYLVYSNQATNGLKIYPPVNGTINDGSANAAITIEGKSLALFVANNSVNYAAIYTANA